MKHCPKCEFAFADFHHVCDFDGTDLVPDAEPLSLVKASTGPSRLRRILKSPVLLTVLVALAVLVSALLIGYLDSATESAPVVKAPPSTSSTKRVVPLARTLNPVPATIKTPVLKKELNRNSNRLARSIKPSRRGKPEASRSVARLQQKSFKTVATAKSQPAPPSKSEIAERQQLEQIAAEQTSTQTVQPLEQRSPQPVAPREPQPISHEKEPRLTAMLKTTWRVIKRPFKF